ncbi:putative leucine-rich repeat-containing protein DDB_G0281931 [Dendronephthya gigantea]|uniref:putative leucine-rich repeat-containing protein DDB_G0281931 n=1 Tax=Dendronephthya gigantea TaxID=151771 RepID=UPI00106B879B|nr:putative leucine-rich repeat-containing protein DDB_G0281931 [Dendronephthya gigantea]
MIGRLHLMIKCGLVVLCLGKYSIVFDKQTFSHVNDSTEQSWDTLNYPHEVRLCMHDLPVVPKEPLILNSTFNATVERGILLEIYRLTNGLNWTNSSGWGGSGSHCQWYGVGCSNITNGRVTVLTLEANRLQGTLPSTLWMLRDLQGLCLDANPGLYGKMEDFLSSNMTRLMRLDLASCNLDGVIPDEIIAGSKSLVKLQLSGNKLGGVIPPSIGQLTELQVLSLGENTPITGKIPEGVGNLSKLWFLDLESLGDLDTTIKPFLGLSSLKFLHMSESGIHGTLPDDFGSSFPLLWECLLSRNYLHGTIPKTMGKLTALAHLNLAGNKFSGQVPKGLGKLNNLEVIDLSNNSLSGFEEGFSFNSSKLALLTVAQNKDFSTQLSCVFKILQSAINSLRRLDFGGCHLTGDIPHVMWSFMNLIEFNVKDNLLSGFLPLPRQNMLFLITLDFSGNKLMGDIPESYADLLSLQTFDVSRNPSLRYAGGDSPKIPRFATTDKSTMIRENENDHYTCPVIRFRYNSGIIKMDSTYYDRVFCECDENYYGTKGRCLHCMSGGSCGNRSVMRITSGYWPSPSWHNTTHLVSCQNAGEISTVCTPTGECKCSVNSTRDGDLITVCDPGCICSKGSGGRYCSKCKRNYYSHSGDCNECPSKDSDKIEILLPIIIAGFLALVFVIWLVYSRKSLKWSVVVVFLQILFVTLLHVFNFVPSWLLEVNIVVFILALVGHGSRCRGVLKISLFYFQLLDAMIGNYHRWPSGVLKIQRYFSNVFNFKFEGLECYFPNLFTPVGKFSSLLLLPLGVIVAAFLVFLIIVIVCKIFHFDDEKIKKARHFSFNIVIMFLNLTYFPIVKRSFSALAPCLEDIDRRYMGQNPWVDCPSHEYRVMRILGYCSLGVYILGVPFILFLPLLICAFWNKGNGVNRDGAGGEGNERDFWMGSLYLAYKEEFRSYIEIFFLLRRAVFAAILSFISYHSPFQVPVLTVGFLICLHFIVACKPYECSSYLKVSRFKVDVENCLECLILVVLLLSFVFLGQDSARNSQNVALLWLVIAGNSLATVVCIAAAVMRLVRKEEQPTPPASAQASETQSLLSQNEQSGSNYGSTDSAASAAEDGQ